MDLSEAEKIRDEWLTQEKISAETFLEIKSIADLMVEAGMSITVQSLADIANMFEADVQSALNWFGTATEIPFEMNGESSMKSELHTLLVAFTWIANRRLSHTKGRNTPPVDRSCLGMQRIMLITEFGRVEILGLIEKHKEELSQRWSDFKPSWYADDRSIIEKNQKAQHPETKRALIREAIMDISKGRIGSVTAVMLEKWRGGAIGLDKRQIDKYLSGRADMRDLDKYRVVGKLHRETEEELVQRMMSQAQ